MQAARLPARRLHSLRRPIRPPAVPHQFPKPRLFTHNSQLLLVISPSGPRPQLPFLHASSSALRYRHRGGQWQLTRFLTTEHKKYIKEQVWLASKWTVFLWTSVGLLCIAAFGVQNEILERDTPTPSEWSMISRIAYRSARAQEDPSYFPSGIVDWANTGGTYRRLMERLEDPNVDGKDVKDQGDGGILVPGVGKAGYDIEAKSEPWRRGYFEVLMGCAKSAEQLDGWVKDTTRNISFPSEYVIGPSNPRPRPCPAFMHSAPLEENCIPAFAQPETYYMKVLTTKGFNTNQRLKAALGYADWLDFKGLNDSAQEMYNWGMDIATSALPEVESVVDLKTGVIREGANRVSDNIVQAATSLATHYACNANVSAALPIYLSVLRARSSAPAAPYPSNGSSGSNGILDTIFSFIVPPQYPPPPPSGNDALRRTPNSKCEETALKTYIGEILFATAPSNLETGLAWTREAVAEAEAGVEDGSLKLEDRDKCAQCLEVGLNNLQKMVAKLDKEEKDKTSGLGGKSSWFSLWGSTKEEGASESKWAAELSEIEDRILRLHREGLRERFKKSGGGGGLTWIG
ncbi:uncharacterized protein K452DRAFT_283533 [Aplosporella prunicola CBS 121167]|uniref:Uncharacterized protein n=1 Tax=Aplosporella prunicola CBS 121167 TaxID=1176127 RepID=A0A6A6BQ85_9PEZI|nr:uncharacterized protein K452DRAFT_283533 [Aplosporella prunicola CBS 121167]KAF2146256.1 hypothetical protein K452DRAFT_283533 [Aplosporella prunicola CBS 121167]